MFELIARRAEGGFIIRVNGVDETILPTDPNYPAAVQMAEDIYLPTVPPANALGLSQIPRLTRRQLRLGLLQLGITSAQVEAVIAALPEPDRSVAMIEWQDATTYEREHPLVAQIAAALGVTAEQIDATWTGAATL